MSKKQNSGIKMEEWIQEFLSMSDMDSDEGRGRGTSSRFGHLVASGNALSEKKNLTR